LLGGPQSPHPLEQIFVVGWIGVSQPQHLRHLLWRTAHPEGTFSFCFLWYFLVHPIYTLVNIFSSRYFQSLCLCDLSISCIRTHTASSCVSRGSVQGVSWGSFFSILLIFIFRHSPTLHIRAFHVRYYRTPSFYWERTVSVCIMTLYSVFVLCVFPPHAFGGLYIWRAIYTAILSTSKASGEGF
jgi:hypothetical protein